MAIAVTTHTLVGSTYGLAVESWANEIAMEYEEKAFGTMLFKDVTSQLKPGSEAVKIPVIRNFSSGTSAISESDERRTTTSLALMSYNTVTVDTGREKGVSWSPREGKIFDQMFRAQVTQKLMSKILGEFDTTLFAAAAASSSLVPIQLSSAFTTASEANNYTMTQELAVAIKMFDECDVPEEGRFWILSSAFKARMHSYFKPGTFDAEVYPWVAGQIGGPKELLGYPCFFTNRLPTRSTGPYSGKPNNMLCHRDAMGLINEGLELFYTPRSATENLDQAVIEHYYGIDSLPDDGTANQAIVNILEP